MSQAPSSNQLYRTDFSAERNRLALDFVTACHKALGVPVHDDFNAAPFADGEKQMLKSKLVTARFFMDHMLPATTTHLARITAGSASMMALPAEAF
jgi:hypothetical protein